MVDWDDKHLALWYRFEEGSGTSARDERGSTAATITSCSYVSGGSKRMGKYYLAFTSGASAVAGPNLSYTSSQPISIAFWFRIGMDGTDTPSSLPMVECNYFRVHIRKTTNEVTCRYDNGSARNSVYALGNGDRNWHHCVATFNGVDTTTLIVDGVLRDSDTHAGGLPLTDYGNVALGDVGGGLNFTGDLDDVRIYTRVLTDADAKHIIHGRGST